MSWYIREVDHGGGLVDSETPDYTSCNDLFTIKLYIGGHFVANPKTYVGGEIRYVDKCDVDQISLLELYSMLTDCGVDAGFADLYYRAPKMEMEYGLFPLTCDSQVVEMCKVLDSSKLIHVYCELSQETLTQYPPPSQPYEKMTDPHSLAFERKQLEDIFELEGISKDMYDIDVLMNDMCGEEIPEVVSDNDIGSFHEDSSNIDSTDEDVRSHKKKKDTLVDVPVHSQNWNLELEESDFSDALMSDEERMVANSTDDEDSEMRYPAFRDEIDMANPKFELGMTFASANSFRRAVKSQAIIERRAIKQVRNFGKRVKFVCEVDGCKWKVYASPMQASSTYQIKTYIRKHTCSQTFEQKQMTSRWISQYYEKDIRMNPTWPLAAFRLKVVNDWKCDVSIHVVGRARRMALKNIKGDHVAEYALLWDYMNEIRKTMPGSTVQMELEDAELEQERRRFKRIYICLGPVKKGFRAGCRPLIGLDGCHLKGPYGGQLLAAVGVDSNDGMYPIAWAVVEVENTDSWNWFLNLLVADVGVVNSGAWTFISDRQKGLINALENVVPEAEHRFCVMHLYNNMTKVHKGRGLRDLLWLFARATNDYMFDKYMIALKKLSKKCYDWLMEKPRSQWSRSGFRTTCQSDMFVNNHCEVFNNSIGPYRDLPIIGLLQGIHKAVMRRIQSRRDKMIGSYQMNPICPNSMRKVNKDLGFSGACIVQWSGNTKYLVTLSDGGHEIVVDLEARTCACRKYQLTGLPCYHACACIRWKNLDMASYIHRTYFKDMFLKTYAHTVEPINSQQYWEKTPFPPPLPLVLRVQPGRPKKKRNKKNDLPVDKNAQKKSKVGCIAHCKICKQAGHNARTCPSKNHEEPQEEPQGESTSSRPKPSSNSRPKSATSCRPKVAKTSKSRGGKVAQGPTSTRPKQTQGTQGSTTDVVLKGPLPSQSSSLAMPMNSTSTSQGGIFHNKPQPNRPTNTPLGIQAQGTAKHGKVFTNMKHVEQARNDRIGALKARPEWKI